MQNDHSIQHYMTLCPHSIGLEQDVTLARKMLLRLGVHHLPVQSGGELVGIISDRDVKFAEAWARDGKAKLNIADIYSPEPYTVDPAAPLSDVLNKMVEDQIGCALVKAGEKLVGIFTTTDACRILAERLSDCGAQKAECAL